VQAVACCQPCCATLFAFIYVYAFRLVIDCQPSQVPTAALPLHSTLVCTPPFHAVCAFFPHDSYGLASVACLFYLYVSLYAFVLCWYWCACSIYRYARRHKSITIRWCSIYAGYFVVYVDSDLTMSRNNDCARVDSTPADKWTRTEPKSGPRSQAGTTIDVMKLQTILYWAIPPPVGQKLGRCLRHKTLW